MDGHLPSTKRLKIDKANTTIIASLAVASFIAVFSLVSARVLFSQLLYQQRVISAQNKTLGQISDDQSSVSNLQSSYNNFISQSPNLIGNSTTGGGPQNISNANLIIDALPEKYDYPALVTSVENLITSQNIVISSISGTDASGTSTTGAESVSSTAVPSTVGTAVAMPFTFVVSGTYSGMASLITAAQNSIRPIQVTSITMTGSDNQMIMTVTAQSYYQPTTNLSVTQETIK